MGAYHTFSALQSEAYFYSWLPSLYNIWTYLYLHLALYNHLWPPMSILINLDIWILFTYCPVFGFMGNLRHCNMFKTYSNFACQPPLCYSWGFTAPICLFDPLLHMFWEWFPLIPYIFWPLPFARMIMVFIVCDSSFPFIIWLFWYAALGPALLTLGCCLLEKHI